MVTITISPRSVRSSTHRTLLLLTATTCTLPVSHSPIPGLVSGRLMTCAGVKRIEAIGSQLGRLTRPLAFFGILLLAYAMSIDGVSRKVSMHCMATRVND